MLRGRPSVRRVELAVVGGLVACALDGCDRPAGCKSGIKKAEASAEDTPSRWGNDSPNDEAKEVPARPTFVQCTDQAAPRRSGRGFRHKRSSLLAAMPANHFAQDVIGHPGTREAVEVKLSYGDIGKDLEDEPVEVLLDTCEAWASLGHAVSDGDGRAQLRVELPSQPGLYAMRSVVDGDGSVAGARVTVAPPGTHVVVFDLDGTLTTSDIEITNDVVDDYYEDLYEGEYVAQAFEGGPELTRTWAEHGYLVIYLTGRPYWLVDKTRQWLSDHGFASGHVHTTDRHRDVIPNLEGVGEFKSAYLENLRERGYEIAAAYGNATTDIWAYAGAEVPKDRTFIIGPHGGAENTQRVTPDWVEHIAWARARPPADQPFSSGHTAQESVEARQP